MMEEATTNIAAGVAGIKSLKTELEDLVTVEVKRKTSLDYYNELEEEGKDGQIDNRYIRMDLLDVIS